MKRCRICNKLIWFWQAQRCNVIKIMETGEYVEHNHHHTKCSENYLSHKQREIMR